MYICNKEKILTAGSGVRQWILKARQEATPLIHVRKDDNFAEGGNSRDEETWTDWIDVEEMKLMSN